MKKLIYFLVFVLTTNFAFSKWSQLTNGLGYGLVYSVAVSGNNAFVGTFNKGVYSSTDLGNNWNPTNLNSNNVISLTISGNSLIAGTDENGIFISTNNGQSWSNTLTTGSINSFAISGNKIYAGGHKEVYVSTNNGSSWTEINTEYDLTISDIKVKGNLIIISSSIGVLISSDNGNSWEQYNDGFDDLNVSTLAVNQNKIFAGTSGGGIYLSTDDGNSWTKKTEINTLNITTLLAYGNNVFAGTFNNNVYFSSDNGNSWTKKDNGLNNPSTRFLTIGGDYIFAATDGGVYRSKLSDLTSTDVNDEIKKNDIFLINPNPASDFIEISGFEDRSDFLKDDFSIKIYNTIGECVLFDKQNQNAGTIRLNIDFLAKGFYYLKIGNLIEKFIKL
ncbi:MAG: hypothetical protein N2319_01850 [Candidatus Kapabacteria bacterium]|nr:hypothetical protein [Candidatus Kapabacteria bacterium]